MNHKETQEETGHPDLHGCESYACCNAQQDCCAHSQQESEKIDEIQLEKELAEYKDKYLRLLAEMENARKRMQKEKHQMTLFGIEKVILELLTPLDNLENALAFVQETSSEVKMWAKGFEMILTQFKEVLQNHNITAFESEGKPFDPHLHEAVETEETDQYPEGIVIKEFTRGYKAGERTIRAARVKVAKMPSAKENYIKEEGASL